MAKANKKYDESDANTRQARNSLYVVRKFQDLEINTLVFFQKIIRFFSKFFFDLYYRILNRSLPEVLLIGSGIYLTFWFIAAVNWYLFLLANGDLECNYDWSTYQECRNCPIKEKIQEYRDTYQKDSAMSGLNKWLYSQPETHDYDISCLKNPNAGVLRKPLTRAIKQYKKNHGSLKDMAAITCNRDMSVANLKTFWEILIFSIENGVTIGYGEKMVNRATMGSVTLLFIFTMLSAIIDTMVIGTIFAKMANPRTRASTIIFSKNILHNKYKKTLSFMITDLRTHLMLGGELEVKCIKHHKTKSGIIIWSYQEKLELLSVMPNDNIFSKSKYDDKSKLFLFTPMTPTIKIESDTLLFEMINNPEKDVFYSIQVIIDGLNDIAGKPISSSVSYTLENVILDDDVKGFKQIITTTVQDKNLRNE